MNMTTLTLDRPRADASRALAATDRVDITVHYHPESSSFTFDGPTNGPVTVDTDGTIHIQWGTEASRELAFILADEPENVLFEGLQLTWSGIVPPLPPKAGDAPLRFEVGCDANDAGQRRTLRLTLYRCLEEHMYSLLVNYQGATCRVDPKIYNQGEGPPRR
jgi:hypothetical protein